MLDTYQRAQAVYFTVEEINKTPDFLPNITLGFHLFDSCTALQKSVSETLQMLSGHGKSLPNYRCNQGNRLAAIIGHSASSYSISLAHILGLYRYPQISHFSTSSLLSNRIQFRSFFRTVPSDAFQSQGLAQLVLHFGWTWIGLVAIDDDYGQQGIQIVKRDILKAGACVAFSETIVTSQEDLNAPHIAQVVKDSTATVVVFFSPDIDLSYVLNEMLRQNITGKVLIATEAWSTSSFLSVNKYSKLLLGTIGFTLPRGSMPGFGDFLNKINPSMVVGNQYIKIFWEQVFDCKFQNQTSPEAPSNSSIKECTSQESLKNIQNNFNDVSSLRSTYNVYLAVHAVAKALSDLGKCNKGDGPFPNGTCADIENFKPWQLHEDDQFYIISSQLLYYIKKLHLNMSNGRQLFFDKNGDPPAVYDIVNWQLSPEGQLQQVKVGSYDTSITSGDSFIINNSHIQWGTGHHKVPVSVCSPSCPPGFRKAAKEGQPLCCVQCIPCPSGEIANHTDSLQCTKCQWDMWPNPTQDHCIPKTQEFLSHEDPLGTTLMATGISSSLVPVAIFGLFIRYKTTPIVRANNYSLSCLLLLSLSLCFLCSLVFIGYPQYEICLLRQVTFGIVFALCVSCILAKTIMVVIAFKATRPGSQLRKWTRPRVSYLIVISCIIIQTFLCIMWLTLSPPFLEVKSEINSGVLIIQCNEGSPLAFWSMLGYLGLLASISFIVAFLARRLPDSFNEAKFITFSMLAFLSVWMSYIPASLSSRGKYMVAMEIFAIQSSTWGLVICMFLPKCFIVVFRPGMNSREKLMAKQKNLNDLRINFKVMANYIVITYIMQGGIPVGCNATDQISFYATSSLLSNCIQFRSFFRTVPSDAFQSRGLAQLVLHFGWTWIGLVAIDNDYGLQGIQSVKRDILKAGACVSFTETLISSWQDRNASHIARVVKDSTVKAVVIFSTDFDLGLVLDEMLRQNVTRKVWIASEAWSISTFLSVNKYSRLLGTIGFAFHGGSMPGFGDFLNRLNPSMVVGNQYIKIFWEQVFGCKFLDQTSNLSTFSIKECTGQESLEGIRNSYNDVSSLRVTYSVYLAVHAIAKALSDLAKCKKGDGPFPNGTCADIENFKPWQLLHYMKKLRLNMSNGRQLFHQRRSTCCVRYSELAAEPRRKTPTSQSGQL
ncbi:vomeronasal type-2 receptor 1-like [Dendropsophus ebraccatus]|uniref:vomeronasal type-2 receptor 1-like n=1 Tax=Dendropsophus ebraccatus TaxID=150705 RepID=UPI00383186F8